MFELFGNYDQRHFYLFKNKKRFIRFIFNFSNILI